MEQKTKRGLAWWAVLVGLVFGMKAGGEFYPFSSFPMYSNLGEEAVVLFVRMEDGTPIPLLDVFGKRESRCKKIWKSKLRELANAAGHHSQDATPEEISAAGEYLLARLLDERYYGKLEAFGDGKIELFKIDIVLTKGMLKELEARIATAEWQ